MAPVPCGASPFSISKSRGQQALAPVRAHPGTRHAIPSAATGPQARRSTLAPRSMLLLESWCSDVLHSGILDASFGVLAMSSGVDVDEIDASANGRFSDRLFELSTQAALLFDDNGCREANPAALRLFGFNDRRFLSQCLLSDLAPPLQPDGADSDEHITALLASARDGGGSGHCMLRHADGSTFPAEITAAAVELDGEDLVHVGIRDTSTETELSGDIEALREELLIAHQRLQHAVRKIDYVAANDPLTGLWNTRHLHKLAQAEADRSRRYAQPVSIIGGTLLNIDAMRAESGEALFDSFWIELAALLTRTVRTADLCARCSPSTFAILTPATGIEAARIVSEKLRRAILANAFTHALSPDVRLMSAQYQGEEEAGDWLRRAGVEVHREVGFDDLPATVPPANGSDF